MLHRRGFLQSAAAASLAVATRPHEVAQQRMSLSTPHKAGVALRSLAGVAP